jgi:hypothetical protein
MNGMDVIRGGISDAQARLAAVLPEVDLGQTPSYLYASAPAPTGPFVDVGRDVARVFALFEQASDLAAATATTVAQVFSDPRLNVMAQRADASAAITQARTGCAALLDEARTIADARIAALRALTEPPRPTPADALQEAQLSNLRVDLRMQLDRVDNNSVTAQLAAVLADYVAEGDAFAVWFLAGTPWVNRYLAARGMDDVEWRQSIGSVVSPLDDETMTRAREVLAALAGGSGLAGALISMRVAIDAALEDVAGGFGIAAA